VWRDMAELVKYGCNNMLTEVQYLDIFEVLVEVATTVEVTTTVEAVATTKTETDRCSGAMASWTLRTELGKRHISIIVENLVTHNFGQGPVWMVA
jgi:hypothetical protein